MFKINFSKVALFLVIVLGMSSCKDYFGDINSDPDNPLEVTPEVLLPLVETRLAYTMGGDAARFLGVYSQHLDGVTRQFTVIQAYGIKAADVDAMWNNLYGTLQDAKQLRSIAVDAGSNHYEAIAKTLEAYTIMFTTDAFGDVPYSDAFQGTAKLQPAVDGQASIYTAIYKLLDEAQIAFEATATGATPGSDDIIFGGDAGMWVKFVHMIRARAYLHQKSYANALTELSSGFTSSADDARFSFGSSTTEASPMYQYNDERLDCEVGATYTMWMDTLNDPRKSFYGASMGTSHPYLTIDMKLPLLTYTEAKFIEAECRMQTEGATATTHQAFLDGIAASLADAGVSSDYATYVAQTDVDPGQANLTLEKIMTQKYLALFLDPEVFTDWRRTGFPALTPNSGSAVPRRLPYGENEVLYNTNINKNLTIFDRVTWDN